MEDRIHNKETIAKEELNSNLGKLKEEIKAFKDLNATAQKARERLKLITHVASIGVWDWDPKLNKTLWDRKMYEIYDISTKVQMTQASWMNCVHPDDVDNFQESIHQSLEESVCDHFEFRIIRPDGSVRYISASAQLVMDKKKETIRVVGVNRDITERKMAEEALQLSEQKLKDSNAAKDKLFSILAHDLVSPFSSVLGFSKLLMLSCKEKDFESIQQYATSINSAANQTFDLLTNLLEWSRSQRNKIQFQPELINLKEIVNRVILLYSFALEEKEIYIDSHIDPDFTLMSDPNMIYTVIRNLISNAIKFTQEESIIKITAIKNAKENEICISDSGVGIIEEAKDKLFDPEGNFTTNGTHKESGTGLGLIICKDFVERHGGNIWIESTENIGTKVCFTIPSNIKLTD